MQEAEERIDATFYLVTNDGVEPIMLEIPPDLCPMCLVVAVLVALDDSLAKPAGD